MRRRIINLFIWLLEIPVNKERIYKGIHNVATKTEMCIAPCCTVRRTFFITVGYVHPSYIPYLAIYHHNLPVISPIDTVGELREGYLEEGMRLHPVLAHTLEKPVAG